MPVSTEDDAHVPRIKASSLMGTCRTSSRTFLKNIAQDMHDRNLGESQALVECVALCLDPPTKSCGNKVCTNGGMIVKTSALNKLQQLAASLTHNIQQTPVPARNNSSTLPSSHPPLAKKWKFRLERQMASSASAEGAAKDFGGSSSRHSRDQRVDLLQYWKGKAITKTDKHGTVLQVALWPLLALCAPMNLCINSTCCEQEGNFSRLSLTIGDLRRKRPPQKVHQFLFLQLNGSLIPGVKRYEAAMSVFHHKYSKGGKKICASCRAYYRVARWMYWKSPTGK